MNVMALLQRLHANSAVGIAAGSACLKAFQVIVCGEVVVYRVPYMPLFVVVLVF